MRGREAAVQIDERHSAAQRRDEVVEEVVEQRPAAATDSQSAPPLAPEVVELWDSGARGLRGVGCAELLQHLKEQLQV